MTVPRLQRPSKIPHIDFRICRSWAFTESRFRISQICAPTSAHPPRSGYSKTFGTGLSPDAVRPTTQPHLTPPPPHITRQPVIYDMRVLNVQIKICVGLAFFLLPRDNAVLMLGFRGFTCGMPTHNLNPRFTPQQSEQDSNRIRPDYFQHGRNTN